MGITERRTRQKEAIRTLILEAAWKIVLKEGWQSLSIRKLADAIEYSVPVIYDHFVNKEAIQIEFIKKGFQLLNETLKQAKEKHSDPEKQIHKIAVAYLDFASKNKDFYQLMFGIGIPSCEMKEQVTEIHSFTEIILEPLRSLINKGINKDINPILKLQTFWAMLLGLTSMESLERRSKIKEMKAAVLDDFIRGFLMSMKV